MSTRGLIGVIVDDTIKTSYNHFDSYPSGLGVDIVNQIADMLKRWGIDMMREQARKVVLVTEDTKPTSKQIKTLKPFADLGVGNQSENDWYCLLRDLQGNIVDTLVVGYMIDSNDFAKDSLFCEWAYIINLDNSTLEVYNGLQTAPHKKGRFAAKKYARKPKPTYEGENIYYPIALIAVFPLNDIPTDFVDICEFNSQSLWAKEDGTEFDDVNMAINSLKVGESCIAYYVYKDEKTPSIKATRINKDKIKIENIEED